MRSSFVLAGIGVLIASAAFSQLPQSGGRRSNVLIFVPDGLRALAVSAGTAPAMTALRDRGVNFKNPHALLPTVTMANASAMATGHYLGDTGAFSNTIFSAAPIGASAGSLTPFLENDAVLGEMDQRFEGNFLRESTILDLARAAGFRTAAIGKVGPTLLFDHTERTGEPTIVIDDATGSAAGIPLSDRVQRALAGAGLPLQSPSRGDNGKQGTSTAAGTTVANTVQQNYFIDAATKAILPMLKDTGEAFVMVVWSRDPDGTHHFQGDSLNQLTPGINGPTSLAAIRNADDDLARLQGAVKTLGLADTTDIVVVADHGFSTISKESRTSPSARADYADVPHGFMPPGFLAIDMAAALKLPLFDPDNKNAPVTTRLFPKRGDGLIGNDPDHPQVVVAANGGSDLVYLPTPDPGLAARVAKALVQQDYVSAIFADDSLGALPGTLPLSAINLKGSSRTPTPSFAVGFRTWSTGCEEPLLCAVEVADTPMQQGQGNHGSFSRADSMNFMAAAGPDFKAGFTDENPVSNADIGRTLKQVLGLGTAAGGKLAGRVLAEALRGGANPKPGAVRTLRAPTEAMGVRTVLLYQVVGETRYFDAAGTIGRTLGLDPVR
jgi:arylsulfatase A-like enzyme